MTKILAVAFTLVCLTTVHAISAVMEASVKAMENGASNVTASFCADVTQKVAWNVITDYDAIDQYSSSVDTSTIIKKTQDEIIVKQKMEGGFLFFKKDFMVLLKIKETPIEKIEFKDTSKKSFDQYSGTWTIEPTSSCMKVTYKAIIKNQGSNSNMILRSVLKGNTKKMLGEVLDEMLRRAS